MLDSMLKWLVRKCNEKMEKKKKRKKLIGVMDIEGFEILE